MKTKMIDPSLFKIEADKSQKNIVGKKRDASSAILHFSDLDIQCRSSKSGDGDGNMTMNNEETYTIRKALSVLANSPVCFSTQERTHEDRTVTTKKSTPDSLSVSTASTSPMVEESSDEESETDNFLENKFSITSLPPPDSLFVLQGKDFPCHAKLLRTEARPLLDILSRDGMLQRKTKKQCLSSCSRSRSRVEQQEAWSSLSGITVARLPDDIDSDSFNSFMQFLYTKEIRIPQEEVVVEEEDFDEDDEQGDPWLTEKEDILTDDDEFEDFNGMVDFSHSQDDDDATNSATPLKYLQRLFLLAGHFGCVSLKNAIEFKLYDEFLFSFTANELFIWADQNGCAFLRDKAMEKFKPSCCSNTAPVTSVEWMMSQSGFFSDDRAMSEVDNEVSNHVECAKTHYRHKNHCCKCEDLMCQPPDMVLAINATQ